MMSSHRKLVWIIGSLFVALAGCAAKVASESADVTSDPREDDERAWQAYSAAHVRQDDRRVVVEDDIAMPSIEDARRVFFAMREKTRGNPNALTLATVYHVDAVWPPDVQTNITYCIEDGFGEHLEAMKRALREGAGLWESSANVRFVHVAEEDGARCTSSNEKVQFQVRAECCGDRGFSFIPLMPRAERVLEMGLALFKFGTLPELTFENLKMVTAHELGHVLGFHHEHVRHPSGACSEDWSTFPGLGSRDITDYDSQSVMHYSGRCDGGRVDGVARYGFSQLDATGVALVYGPPRAP